jgi:hypothetical protein
MMLSMSLKIGSRSVIGRMFSFPWDVMIVPAPGTYTAKSFPDLNVSMYSSGKSLMRGIEIPVGPGQEVEGGPGS